MSGLLSGLLTAVAIVATVMTGGALGIVAGALMAASYAASKGWIGGSVGKFFNSSTGHYLTLAVGLASAGASLYSNMNSVNAASAAKTTAGAEANVNAATEASIANQGAQAGNAAAESANAAAPAMSGGAAATGAGPGIIAAPTVNGTMAQTMTGGTQYGNSLMDQIVTTSSDGTLPSGLTPQAQQFAQTTATQNAINSGVEGVGSNIPTGTNGDAATNLGITNVNKTQMAGVNADMSAVNPTTQGAGDTSGLQPVDTSKAVAAGKANAAQGAINEGEIANAPDAKPGMLSRGMDLVEKHPGLTTMAGNALSGMASGAAQQKMMQEQIAANQWGNMQWMDKGQVANMQAAAAAPIGVPGGYLARAQSVQNMLKGAQPTPLPGGPAATPTVAPLGAGQTGPVPASAMPANPRGGM